MPLPTFARLCVAFLLLAVIGGGSCLAATYHVDSQAGDDGRDGTTEATAWKTLDKANTQVLQPGDRLLLRRGGSWTGTLRPQGSGTAENRVVVGAYGEGPRPRIHAGGAEDVVVLHNLSFVTLEGLEITNPAENIERRARGVYILADQPGVHEGIIVRDNEIHHIDGNVIQAARGMNGAVFTNSVGNEAKLKNLLVEDNHIRDITVRGFSGNQGATNWERLETMHQGLVIRRNRIENTGCDAIRVVCWRDVLVEHNIIDRAGANTRGYEAAWIAAAFPQQSVDTVWQFNEISRTAPTVPTGPGDLDSQPFDIDHHCGGTHVFQYNYTRDNAGGFFLFMGDIVDRGKPSPFVKAIIRYNVSQNDGAGVNRLFEVHGFKGKRFAIEVYHNTFYYGSGTMGLQLKGDTPGLAMWNNIFHAPAGHYPVGDVDYSHNLYFDHAGPASDGFAIRADPKLAHPGGGSEGRATAAAYQVTPGSAAIGTGLTLADPGSADFWGNNLPQGPPTVGAHASRDNPAFAFVETPLPVANGGFEQGSADAPEGFSSRRWAGDPRIARDSSVPHVGGASLRIENNSADDRGAVAIAKPIPVTPGHVQTCTVMLRTRGLQGDYAGTGSGGASIVLLYKSADGEDLGSRIYGPGVIENEEDWRQVAIDYRAPEGAASLVLHVALQGTGTAWFDDLQVTERSLQRR